MVPDSFLGSHVVASAFRGNSGYVVPQMKPAAQSSVAAGVVVGRRQVSLRSPGRWLGSLRVRRFTGACPAAPVCSLQSVCRW